MNLIKIKQIAPGGFFKVKEEYFMKTNGEYICKANHFNAINMHTGELHLFDNDKSVLFIDSNEVIKVKESNIVMADDKRKELFIITTKTSVLRKEPTIAKDNVSTQSCFKFFCDAVREAKRLARLSAHNGWVYNPNRNDIIYTY